MCARTCDWRSGSAPPVYTLYRALLPTIQSPFSQFRRPDELISTAGPLTLAKSEAARTELLRAESRGKEKPTLEKKSKCMAPMAELDTDGELVWDDNFTATMEKLAETPVKPKKKKK